MKSIILCAGQGSRLRPLTNEKPKCMVELFGKPILNWQIDVMNNCGIRDIIVATGYKKEIFNDNSLTYFTNPDYESTNMVETLFCASKTMNSDFIVSYGDIVYDESVLNSLLTSSAPISVVIDKKWEKLWNLRFENPLMDAESLELDKEGNIVEIGQKVSDISKIEGQFIGLMKFQGKGVEMLKKFYSDSKNISLNGINPLNPKLEFKKSYMTDLLQGMIRSGIQLSSVPVNNGWLELDSLDDFDLYSKLEKQNTLQDILDLKTN
jgi:L-glutamine-phosphate cytidylyltransferase